MATSVQKIVRVHASRKRKMTAPTYFPPQEEVVKSPTPMNTSWRLHYASRAKAEPFETQQPTIMSPEQNLVNDPLVAEQPQDVVTVAPTSVESLPLHESAKWRYPLIVTDAAEVNERDSRQRTPLHWVLVTHNKTAAQKMSDVILLLEAGAEIDPQDDQGKTPLILAIESGLEDIACLLLDRGADPNAPDSRYWTPLHHAVKMLSSRLVEKLLANGTVDIEATTDEGETPLLICAREGKPAAQHIAPILLKHKANPDNVGDVWLRSNRKRTPLHWAAELNNELMVKALIESGANRNAQDADGRTPLFLAANNCSDSAVRMLLHLHADSTLADVDDKTPLRAAHEKRFDSVVKVFEENKAAKTNAISGLPTLPLKLRRIKQSPPMDAIKIVAKQNSSSGIKIPKLVPYQPPYTSHPYMPPAAAYGADLHNMTGRQQWHAPQQSSTANTPRAPKNNAWAAQSPHHHHTGLSPMFSSWVPLRDDRAPAFFMQMPNSTPAARPAPAATLYASPQDARGVPTGSAPQSTSPQTTSCADKPAPSRPQLALTAVVENGDIVTPVTQQSSVMLTPPSESKQRSSSSSVKPEPNHDGGSEVLDEFFAQHPYNVTQLLSL